MPSKEQQPCQQQRPASNGLAASRAVEAATFFVWVGRESGVVSTAGIAGIGATVLGHIGVGVVAVVVYIEPVAVLVIVVAVAVLIYAVVPDLLGTGMDV